MKAVKNKLIGIVLGIGFLFVMGCSDGSGTSTSESGNSISEISTIPTRVVPVETTILKPETFEDIIQVTGVIASMNDVVVSAQSAGTLEYVTSVGARVAKGAVVARIDDSLAQAGLDQAKASLEVAEAQVALAADVFNRQEPLYRDSIISAIEFERVKTQLTAAKAQKSQAQAMVRQAEKQVRNTKVYAPFSGTVEQRLAEPGAQAVPGLPIVQIVSTANVKVVAGVSERYAKDIRRGQQVRLNFSAYNGEERQGTITFVGSTINPNSRTFPIEIQITNGDGFLKPQMSVDVYIVRETLREVITVPQNATLSDENGKYVYIAQIIEGKKVASRRGISIGPIHEGKVVVTDGLYADDEVVVVGQTTISEGDVIDVLK